MRKIMIVFIFIFLSACTAAITPSPTLSIPTERATLTSTQSPPKNIPTLKWTPRITTTYTSQKMTEDAWQMILKTQESFNVDCMVGLLSPDGKWLACDHDYLEAQSGMYIKYYLDEEPTDITIGNILENYRKWSAWNLSPVKFSKDGTYLYFDSYIAGDGGDFPVCFNYLGVNGLYKLNLFTKRIDPIIPPSFEGDESFFYEISPTERRLAYFTLKNETTLNIVDLKTGEKFEYVFPEHLNDHSLSWSEDGTRLAFITGLDDLEKVNSSTLRILDIQTGKIETVYQSTDRCLSEIEWKPDNKIIVSGIYYDTPETIMEFNLNTNSMSLLTPTPNP